MIDDDDKLRRNVVVFSTVVLAVSFLDLPIGSVGAKFLGGDGATVSPFRVWLIALLVLFYLVIRFSFPEEPTKIKPVADWKQDYMNRRSQFRQKRLVAQFDRRRAELQDKDVQTYIPTDHLPNSALPQLGQVVRHGKSNWRLADFRPDEGMFWSGTAIYGFTVPNDTNTMSMLHEVRDPFRVPMVWAAVLNVRSAFLSTLYSGTAANWLFPRALAVLATFWIAVKLVHTW